MEGVSLGDNIFFVNGNMPREFPDITLEEGYASFLWEPSLGEIVPRGMPYFPFGVWWVMHFTRIFSNTNYSILLIRYHDSLVHRSIVTPGYFRFPFMQKEDLQIGDTWTSPEHRGKGLAVFAIRKIIAGVANKKRRIWYIVEKNNIPSIKAAEKAGFVRYGEGVRRNRFGVGVLGYYAIENRLDNTACSTK